MDRNKLLLAVAGLAAFAVAGGGFFLGVQPQLATAAAAKAQEATVASQNASLVQTTGTLKTAYLKMDSLTSQLSALRTSIPTAAGSPDLIREIDHLASGASMNIVKIQIGDPEAYTPPVAATTPATTAASTSTATASASPSASATATPARAATTPVAPVPASDAAVTAANFSVIPVTVEVGGSYAEALQFLHGLRSGGRQFAVSTITSGTTGGSSTTAVPQAPNDWTVSGFVFVFDPSAGATTTPSTTTGTSTAANTTGSSSSSTDTAAGK